MNGEFASTLTSTDWNAEWKALQAARKRSEGAEYWDEKAKSFPVKHGAHTDYVTRFLSLAGVRPGETVLDMGCGTGTLATPLADMGCHVLACDFSRGMLDKMTADQAELGVTGVEVRQMSWSDDWEAFGIGPKCADLAFASRSIVTDDLQDSLMRLDRTARRRVCITLPCGPSPRTDERLLEAAGLSARLGRDFMYAFNILASMGINPEVAYIPSVRMELYDTFEEACEGFTEIAMSAAREMASPEEAESIPSRMRSWLEGNLVHDERGYHLSEDRKVTWAFIAWNPR